MIKCTFSNELGYPALIVDTDGFGLVPYILVNPSTEYEWGMTYYPVAFTLVNVDLDNVVCKLKREELTQDCVCFTSTDELSTALENLGLPSQLPAGVLRMFKYKEEDRPKTLNSYEQWMATQGLFKETVHTDFVATFVKQSVPPYSNPELESALIEAANASDEVSKFKEKFTLLQRYILVDGLGVNEAVHKVESEMGVFPVDFLVQLKEKGVMHG